MPDPEIPAEPDPAPPYAPPQPDNDPGLPGAPEPAPAYDPPEPDTVSQGLVPGAVYRSAI